LGTCAVGMGATVRQPSLRTRAGATAGRTTPVPRTALGTAATNVGLDSLDFRCSADAQQLSACAWLKALTDSEPFDSVLCIGQVLSAQHAMRASGVDAQPAQIATLPAEIRTASASANNRLPRVSTSLGCRTERLVSNRPRWCGSGDGCLPTGRSWAGSEPGHAGIEAGPTREVDASTREQSRARQLLAGMVVGEKNRCVWISAPMRVGGAVGSSPQRYSIN